MCFSANASFTVSAVLLIGGTGTLRYVKTPSQLPFALIPLLFSAQQFCEGLLWLSFSKQGYEGVGHTAAYLFLAMAQVVWPALVPWSIWLLEKEPGRKRVLAALLGMGMIVSAYLLYCLLSYPVHYTSENHHIRYDLDFPHRYLVFSGIFYFIPTVMPPFISSVKKMMLIGSTILASFLVAKIFFGEYVISVWCYFAAAISIIVFLVMRSLQKPAPAGAKIAP